MAEMRFCTSSTPASASSHRAHPGLAGLLGVGGQGRLGGCVAGDLRRRTGQLLHRGGDLHHGRRLLGGARGQLRGGGLHRIAGRGHVGGAVLDLLDQGAQGAGRRAERRGEAIGQAAHQLR